MKKYHIQAKIAIIIAGLLPVFFLCGSAVNLQGQANNSITGFVFGTERSPLSEIQVEILDEFNRLILRVRTDGAGRYNCSQLPRGRYYIHISTSGTDYEEETREVEIAGISRGGGSESIQQNFYLRTKRSRSSSAAINGVVFVQEIPKEAKDAYEKAVSDLKGKKTEAGLVELKTAIEIFPDYYLALAKLGQEYINLQKYDEARNVLAKAVTINVKNYESQYALGYSLYKLKNYVAAIEAIRKAVEINPSSINSLFLLGVNLKQVGKYEDAVESLRKAERLVSVPTPEIHWQLSLIYTNDLKNYKAAVDELELFLKAKPDYEEADKVRELIKKLKTKAK